MPPPKPDGEIVSAAVFHQATSDVSVVSHLTERMMSIVAADARSWLIKEFRCSTEFRYELRRDAKGWRVVDPTDWPSG
jgi:hypothetical protein